METMSSQTAVVETAPQPEQPETKKPPETTVADARDNYKKTLEKPSVTFDGLLSKLELCMQKSWQGDLDVKELEQLTADFATFLTYRPSEQPDSLSEKLNDFYTQLKRVVSESLQDERVTGTSERKNVLKNLAEGLNYKFTHFKKTYLQKNDDNYKGATELMGMVGG